MEKLLLRGLFPREELYIVYQKHVDVAVTIAERHAFFFVSPARADIGNKIAGELFASGVKYGHKRVIALYIIRYRVHYVGFAKPRSAVNKQGVISRPGILGYGFRGGIKIPVAVADDEGVESVFGVERRGFYLVFFGLENTLIHIIFFTVADVYLYVGKPRAGDFKRVADLVYHLFRLLRE